MSTELPSYREQPPKLLAGVLCLDFVNTVAWRGDPVDRGERLTSYAELAHWARHAGLVDAATVKRLVRDAERRRAAAQAVLARALELREALARLASAGKRASPTDIAIVNALLAKTPARAAIVARGSYFSWNSGSVDDPLDALLHPVVWSAADLLTSKLFSRVRRCGDERCSWMFLDLSPSRRRRWCSMQECGNRAKVRRHHQRSRTDAARTRRSPDTR